MDRRFALVALLALAPALARAADQPKHKKGGGESYIQMEPLAATILRPDGRRGVMTVEVGVDATDPALLARATQSLPLLRANYAEALRNYATGLPPGSPPNADYLSLALQRQTDMTLGRPGARLLLGTILVN